MHQYLKFFQIRWLTPLIKLSMKEEIGVVGLIRILHKYSLVRIYIYATRGHWIWLFTRLFLRLLQELIRLFIETLYNSIEL